MCTIKKNSGVLPIMRHIADTLYNIINEKTDKISDR